MNKRIFLYAGIILLFIGGQIQHVTPDLQTIESASMITSLFIGSMSIGYFLGSVKN